MADNLLETYNPLYDVHLRQYFALPHMQKHLRDIGLLEAQSQTDGSTPAATDAITPAVFARHQQMMELLLRNRERVLAQLADVHKKLDAAEKVEICRRIRSGLPIHIDEEDAAYASRRAGGHASRSLSRPARGRSRRRSPTGETARRRRRSTSVDDSNELIKRIEADYRSDTETVKNPQNIYNRLAASVYKYQYLHKMDDRTLTNYKESLRRQLQKLERFRELSFGPNSVAKHQPLTTSWFFKRRSLPSLEPPAKKSQRASNQHRSPNKLHHRSRLMRSSRNARGGKSQSPPASASEAPPKNRYGTSRSRASYRHPRPEGAAGETQQRLPPITKRAPVKTTPVPAPAAAKAAKLPTATVKPTIQQKRNKSAAKAANGKVSTGKPIANNKPLIAPEIEQLRVIDHLTSDGQTKPSISPGSSIAASSGPDADGEDDTESRQSIDSALAGATAEEDRAYSSRSSTSAYADSLNDDAPLSGHGGTATETRPTPEPVLIDDDDQIARHQFELPRSESMASLKTLSQASGVNQTNPETVETPRTEKPSNIGFEKQPEEITATEADKSAYQEDHSPSEEIRNIRKREIEEPSIAEDELTKADTYAQDRENIEQVSETHESFSAKQVYDEYQTETEKPTEEVVYLPPDTEQNMADIESKGPTPPTTPPSSAKEQVEPLTTASTYSVIETEKEPISSDYSISHPVENQDQYQYQYGAMKDEYHTSDLEYLHRQAEHHYAEQIADDEKQISELEQMEKSHNELEHSSDDIQQEKRSESTANVSLHANADVSQLYDSSNDATENHDSQIDSNAFTEPQPEIERKLFKPAPEREYISDEDDIVEGTTEMRDEVNDYLKDAESVIKTELQKDVEPIDVDSSEQYEKVTDRLDANDNLISSVYETYETESDLPVDRESVVSTEHEKETVLPHERYSEELSHPEQIEYEDHNITKNNQLLTENKIPTDVPSPAESHFDEALQNELSNLETTDNFQVTPSEEYSIKKSLAHRFPSTPQNSFSHLEELGYNFAGGPTQTPEFQQNKVNNEEETESQIESNGETEAENLVHESAHYSENFDDKTNNNSRGDDVDSHACPIVVSNNPVNDGNDRRYSDIEEKHSPVDETYQTFDSSSLVDEPSHPAEDKHYDEQSYQANDHYHAEEPLHLSENNYDVEESSRPSNDHYNADEPLHVSKNIHNQTDNESSIEQRHKRDADGHSDQDSSEQQDDELIHHHVDNHDYEESGHLCAEKTLLDDEDIAHEGKGEIATFDGETRHYDRRSSKHLSHNEIDAYFPQDLSPADDEKRFEPEEQPIDESGQEERETEPTGLNKVSQDDEEYQKDDDHRVENNGNEELFRHQENLHNSTKIDINESEWQTPVGEQSHEEQKSKAWQEAHEADSYDTPQADRHYGHDDDQNYGLVGNDETPADIHSHHEEHANVAGEAFDEIREVDANTKTHYHYDEPQYVRSSPTHAESQNRQPSSFLAQPSIEITLASDYDGSTEHVNRLADAQTPESPPSPTTPSQSHVDESHSTHQNVDAAAVNYHDLQISYSNGQKSMTHESQSHHSDTDEDDRYNESSTLIQRNDNGHVSHADSQNVYDDGISAGHHTYYRSAPNNDNSNGDSQRNKSDEDEDEYDSGSVVIHSSQRSSDDETTAQRNIYSEHPIGRSPVKADVADSFPIATVVTSASATENPSNDGRRNDN